MFPAEARTFFILHHILICSGVHPVLYPVGRLTARSFPQSMVGAIGRDSIGKSSGLLGAAHFSNFLRYEMKINFCCSFVHTVAINL
jgi:hypothetical protein